jgi:death-on-curing protein
VIQPLFLTLDEALELHRESIDRYGGCYEIRDMGLLQSALAMPAAFFGGDYLHPTLPAMGAALLFHLVQNHPFVDGKKRIGAAAARVFLLMNDIAFDPPAADYEQLVLGVASGRVTKEQTTAFFEQHARA